MGVMAKVDFCDIPDPKIIMTPEELEDLLDALEDRYKNQKHGSHFMDSIIKSLGTQGTQRGLIMIITTILVTYFHADIAVVESILGGAALIYGTHDVVTEG